MKLQNSLLEVSKVFILHLMLISKIHTTLPVVTMTKCTQKEIPVIKKFKKTGLREFILFKKHITIIVLIHVPNISSNTLRPFEYFYVPVEINHS